jgi:hypothetical protein
MMMQAAIISPAWEIVIRRAEVARDHIEQSGDARLVANVDLTHDHSASLAFNPPTGFFRPGTIAVEAYPDVGAFTGELFGHGLADPRPRVGLGPPFG